jgi:hypothetical protein
VSDAVPVRSPDHILEIVVEGLLAVDLPEAGDDEIREAAAAAAAHAAGMPDLSRVGIRFAGVVLVSACVVPARGHLAGLPSRRRGQLLAQLGGLPFVGEYLRLARGLGLVCYYDRVAGHR